MKTLPILAMFLALTLAVPAHGGPPVCDSAPCNAPASAFVENEACVGNNDVDIYNSGCNAVAPTISDFLEIVDRSFKGLLVDRQCGHTPPLEQNQIEGSTDETHTTLVIDSLVEDRKFDFSGPPQQVHRLTALLDIVGPGWAACFE